MQTKEIYTVSRLAFEARSAIEQRFSLIWIEGEVSNLSRPASGHLYFTLKDRQAQVRCALFRNRRQQLGTEPENGKQVLIRARVTIYEGRSEFQLLVEQIEAVGEGLLLQQLELLKTKLQAEGLFDEIHKKPLPRFPRTIALITSPVGAAVRDLIITLGRRYPLARIILLPSEVQGAQAANRLTKQVQLAQQIEDIELIILARGGGSIEDLQAFNDEPLVRTIFAASVPVIAGIGHESDWTLADLVADVRAATPTAAAELATPDQLALRQQVNQLCSRLIQATERGIVDRQQRVDGQRSRLTHPSEKLKQVGERLTFNWQHLKQLQQQCLTNFATQLNQLESGLQYSSPRQLISRRQDHLQHLRLQVQRQIDSAIVNRRHQLGQTSAALSVLNPLATLARGYAVVRNRQSNKVISNASQVETNDTLQIQLRDASIICRVDAVEDDHPPTPISIN